MKQLRLSIKIFMYTFSFCILSCQTKPDRGFKQIPKGMSDTEALIRGIKPLKKYNFWVCLRKDFPGKVNPITKIITGKGDTKKLMNYKFNEPISGFKSKMWIGYYYIAYLENDSLKLATNEKQLVKFIGSINSLEEALLIADIKDLAVDYSRPIGCSFKKSNSGYDLYLAKFHKCFVKTEPFKFSVDTSGNCSNKSLGFYYDVDDNTCLD